MILKGVQLWMSDFVLHILKCLLTPTWDGSLCQKIWKTSEHSRLESCLHCLDNLDFTECRRWTIMKRQAGKSLNWVISLQSTSVYSLVTMARCSVGEWGLNPAWKKGKLLQQMANGEMSEMRSNNWKMIKAYFRTAIMEIWERITWWCLEE